MALKSTIFLVLILFMYIRIVNLKLRLNEKGNANFLCTIKFLLR